MFFNLKNFISPLKNPENKKVPIGTELLPVRLSHKLYLPLIGERQQPRTCKVSLEQKILKGEIIADNQENSLPLHAPTSGTIVDICKHPVANVHNDLVPTVVLESDTQDKWVDKKPFKHLKTIQSASKLSLAQLHELHQHLNHLGTVGMGGAGYPTIDKILLSHQLSVHTIVINLCECETIISCDQGLTENHANDIAWGIIILLYAVQAKKAVIVVEDNKILAIKELKNILPQYPSIKLKILPTAYPNGHEKQLLSTLFSIKIKTSEKPYEYGYSIFNVATCYAIYRACMFGEPLIQRLVTLSDGLRSVNQWALIGTPLSDLLVTNNISYNQHHQLIMGGPMNGILLTDSQSGLLKTSNCIISLKRDQSNVHAPCIRCGDCVTVCPVNLLPQQLFWYAQSKQNNKSEEYRLFDCIECGNCAFVCPSKIPLVQYYRLQKIEITLTRLETQKVQLAKKRHDKRTHRLEQERHRYQELLKQKRLQAQQKLVARKAQHTSQDEKPQKSVPQAIAIARAKAIAKKRQAEKKQIS